jgi:outer membrane PBP1 activator LpoA protein
LYPKGDAYYQRLKESIEHLFYDFYGDWAVIRSYKMNQVDYSESIKKVLKINDSEARNKQLSAFLKRDYQFIPRRRQDIDFIVLLGNKKHLKLLYPQLAYWYASELPVYSNVKNQREFTVFDPDLNGLTLINPPWSEDLALEFLGESALELVLNSHCLQTLYLWERNKPIGWNLSADNHQFFYKTTPIILKP